MLTFKRFTKYICIALISLMISTLGIQTNYLNSQPQSFNNFNVTVGTVANASPPDNYNNLYTSAVIMLRNAFASKLLNIAEGPVGPHVVWSPETAEQNHDNTIVVIKKEGVNIVQLMNRHTRKVLGVSRSGLSESKLEVQTPTFAFDQYQSFYVDYLPNGNIYFTSVAFPTKIITLPYGGTRNDFTHYILYNKEGVSESLQSQFIVDMQGDGANTSFGKSEVTSEAPAPEVTKPQPTPIPEVKQAPVTKPNPPVTNQVTNQYDKLRTGAVIVLRNADLNQSVNIRNLTNGSVINGAPASTPVDDEMILVAVNKPGTNIYQFFNRKNGKVLSVSTKGQVGSWAEVWNRVPGFNPYQSFYIDTLPNGNIVLCPVAFPSLVLNLPEGGRSTTYQRYTLWSKEDLINGLNRQFRVDVLDYGAVTAMPKVDTVNTPAMKTQYQTAQGTINLVNNNPINVVGSKSNANDWSAFDGIIDEPLRNNPHFMFYASNLPKVKNVQTIGNYCPEIYRGEFTDNLGAFSIVHVNACGKVYTYMNKQAMYVMKGNLINTGGNTVLMGTLLSLTGVGLAPSAVLTAGVIASLSNLNTSIDTCINRGGNSAWMNTAVGIVPLNVSCSF